MERKSILIVLGIFMLVATTRAEATYRERIYKAYITNSMDQWRLVVNEMEHLSGTTDSLLMELVNYQYGLIGYALGVGLKGEAKELLDKMERHLEQLRERHGSLSDINAYSSSVYGFKIGLAPLRAPLYGPLSLSAAKEALEQNPANPLALLVYGLTRFYMPEVFGGSKRAAIDYYLKAEQAWSRSSACVRADWNYLSLLVTIAQAYELLGEYRHAKLYYEKILRQEPHFRWVRDDLYPTLLAKINRE